MTIPRHIVRHWKLEPGARLVVRSTDEGVLLYPRYFLPYADTAWMSDHTEHADVANDDDADHDDAEHDDAAHPRAALASVTAA